MSGIHSPSHLLPGTSCLPCPARARSAATSRHGRHARPLPARRASRLSRASSGNEHASSSDSTPMHGSPSSWPCKGAGAQQSVQCRRPSSVASSTTGTQGRRRRSPRQRACCETAQRACPKEKLHHRHGRMNQGRNETQRAQTSEHTSRSAGTKTDPTACVPQGEQTPQAETHDPRPR